MKPIFILLILCFAKPASSFAQLQSTKKWGATASLSLCKTINTRNKFRTGAALTLYSPKLYFAALNFNSSKYGSINMPSYYSTGWGTQTDSDDKMSIQTISIGKLLQIQEHLRIGVEAGISNISVDEKIFTPISYSSPGNGFSSLFNGFFEPSHSISSKSISLVGFQYKATIAVPINNTAGFSMSYWHNYNKYKPLSTLDFSFFIGTEILK